MGFLSKNTSETSATSGSANPTGINGLPKWLYGGDESTPTIPESTTSPIKVSDLAASSASSYVQLGTQALSLATALLTAKTDKEIKAIELQISQLNLDAKEREALITQAREKTALLASQDANQQKTNRTQLIVVAVVVVAGIVGLFAFLYLKDRPAKPKPMPVAKPIGSRKKGGYYH